MPAQGFDNSQFPGVDKFIHLVFFSVLAYFSITGIVKQYRFSARKYKAASYGLIYAMAFGIATEIGQSQLGYRSFDIYDIVANLIGSVAGFLYFQIWISRCLRSNYTFK